MINRVRGFLYRLARALGDVNAIIRGRVGRRIVRRAAGRVIGKTIFRRFR